MMKKLLAGLVAVLFLVYLTATPVRAVAATATVVTEHVVLNGITFNNVNAKYPLLRYRDITYFPLTYDLCRFMGLGSQWSQQSGLQITKLQDSAAYVPDENTINRAGNVPVSIPTYGIKINGKSIRNSSEPWPLLNYKGITYFPLTWRFAVDEFGWSYNWSAEEGLRIASPGAVSDARENLLAIVNKSSFATRTFNGKLLDKGAHSIKDFTATTELTFAGATTGAPPAAYLRFHGTPFVFASIEGGFIGPGSPGIDARFDNTCAVSVSFIGVSGNYVGAGGKTAAQEFSNSERAYLLRCFLKLRFIGQQRAAIVSAAMISSNVNTETWQLVVDMPDEGFFARPVTNLVHVTVVIDALRGRVLTTELENDRYRLELAMAN